MKTLTRTDNGGKVGLVSRKADHVLNVDIYAMRQRAEADGDAELVAVCDAALGRPSGFHVLCACTQEVARELCIERDLERRIFVETVTKAIDWLKMGVNFTDK